MFKGFVHGGFVDQSGQKRYEVIDLFFVVGQDGLTVGVVAKGRRPEPSDTRNIDRGWFRGGRTRLSELHSGRAVPR